jgi:hypothetical protein
MRPTWERDNCPKIVLFADSLVRHALTGEGLVIEPLGGAGGGERGRKRQNGAGESPSGVTAEQRQECSEGCREQGTPIYPPLPADL